MKEAPDRSAMRLAGEVAYDDHGWEPEVYWFETDAPEPDALNDSGDPWLACLLPLAATLGEPLRIHQPLDPRLLEGARELLRIWTAWYPSLHEIEIVAPVARESFERPERRAAFYSGGIDSSFTVLRNAQSPWNGSLHDLITVVGFDVPLEAEAAGNRLLRRHEEVAAELDLRLVAVRTNLRQTRWRLADWGLLAHGPALAAVALSHAKRYNAVRVAATGGYRDLHPWGSHPLTDPLFSTRSLEIIHDGAAFPKVQKLREIAGSAPLLGALHVCWRSEDDTNCGRCSKCYRTMLLLELLNALPQCPTFDADVVDVDRAARLFCAKPWDVRELRDILDLAVAEGRDDIAAAVTTAKRRSRALRRRLDLLRRLRESALPGASRLSWLEEVLLRGWIE